jgi:hypothetical protein
MAGFSVLLKQPWWEGATFHQALAGVRFGRVMPWVPSRDTNTNLFGGPLVIFGTVATRHGRFKRIRMKVDQYRHARRRQGLVRIGLLCQTPPGSRRRGEHRELADSEAACLSSPRPSASGKPNSGILTSPQLGRVEGLWQSNQRPHARPIGRDMGPCNSIHPMRLSGSTDVALGLAGISEGVCIYPQLFRGRAVGLQRSRGSSRRRKPSVPMDC